MKESSVATDPDKLSVIPQKGDLSRFDSRMRRRHTMSKAMNNNASGGAVYGLGFIGAAVYFISNAAGFWMGVLGFLKALVWPAFLVYEAFRHFGM